MAYSKSEQSSGTGFQGARQYEEQPISTLVRLSSLFRESYRAMGQYH